MSSRANWKYSSKVTSEGVNENLSSKLRYRYKNKFPSLMNYEQILKNHIRRKRFLWSNSDDHKESTEAPNLNLITEKSTNTEFKSTPKSWKSWFSNVVGKAKNTYARAVEKIKSKTSDVKESLKNVGKKIARGFLKVRKYFTRSEDKFNLFANKVKLRVEEGDPAAIDLLHKLGIDVYYNETGHLVGSEVNKSSLPVKDILIKEGFYYESNKSTSENTEIGNLTSSINLKSTSLKPMLTNYSTSGFKDTTRELFSGKISSKSNTGINGSLNFLHTTPHPNNFLHTEPSIFESKFTYASEPYNSASMRHSVKFTNSFSLTDPRNSSKSSATTPHTFHDTKSTNTRLVSTFSKIFKFTASNILSETSSEYNSYNSEIPYNINSITTPKLFGNSQNTRVQNGLISTYPSTNRITINQTINTLNLSSSSLDLLPEYSSTKTQALKISSTNNYKSTKKSTVTSSNQFASYTKKSTEKSAATLPFINTNSKRSTENSVLTSTQLNSFSSEPIQKLNVSSTSKKTYSETYSETSLRPILNINSEEPYHHTTKNFHHSSFTTDNLIRENFSSYHLHPSVINDKLSEMPVTEPKTTPIKTVTFPVISTTNPNSVSSTYYDSSTTTTKTYVTTQTRKDLSLSSFTTSGTSLHPSDFTEKPLTTPTTSKASTEPPPFPDIFGESNVRERLHEVFMKGDFSHDDLRTTFEFDPALYESYYYDYDFE